MTLRRFLGASFPSLSLYLPVHAAHVLILSSSLGQLAYTGGVAEETGSRRRSSAREHDFACFAITLEPFQVAQRRAQNTSPPRRYLEIDRHFAGPASFSRMYYSHFRFHNYLNFL
jgi:hypothetical protein